MLMLRCRAIRCRCKASVTRCCFMRMPPLPLFHFATDTLLPFIFATFHADAIIVTPAGHAFDAEPCHYAAAAMMPPPLTAPYAAGAPSCAMTRAARGAMDMERGARRCCLWCHVMLRWQRCFTLVLILISYDCPMPPSLLRAARAWCHAFAFASRRAARRASRAATLRDASADKQLRATTDDDVLSATREHIC